MFNTEKAAPGGAAAAGGGGGGGGGGRKNSVSPGERGSLAVKTNTQERTKSNCSSPTSAAATPAESVRIVREEQHHHHPEAGKVVEGLLSKYTNLIQGWQNRYFVLNWELGVLQYFVNEQCKGQKPRGVLHLSGALISPSDEVSHMFIVQAASGEVYKLRAGDAKERLYWVNQLQASARHHTENNAKTTPSIRARSLSLLPPGVSNPAPPGSQKHLTHSGPGIVTITHHKSPATARRAKNQCPGRLLDVKEMMNQAEGQQKSLVHSIESLPPCGPLSALDQDLLLLKATSAATMSCLGECLNILQQSAQQAAQHSKRLSTDSVLGWQGPRSRSAEQLKNGNVCSSPSMPSNNLNSVWSATPSQVKQGLQQPSEQQNPEVINPEDEITDTEENVEEDLGVMDDQRSVILHLLSQLKLGMDLTRVVLPTFILEKRSLLEMYANFMAHADMFVSITAGTTAEERIISFVEYYLTAFHEGRKGAVAKKPYNPIIGETFHCSWDVPKDKVKANRANGTLTMGKDQPKTQQAIESSEDPTECYKVRFAAEQVSHHPPVSGFYCECKERKICVNAHVWTKSKFMGMSIGVTMAGEGVLFLGEHDEDYVFTLPCAYARSILTVPWVELGGKVSINCAKSGYSAAVTFHTKPFYGGKVHRVTAEVKHNPTNTIVCKAQGEWNGTLEFTYSNGEAKVIDTTKLPVIRKKIRPIKKQGLFESRRLWELVTNALQAGNINAATENKHILEERQRAEERQRTATNTLWKPKFFLKEGDGWVYYNPLWKTHC
ncbi:oxysterol-binding protein-related protein 10-like isoform X1 [Carcharodon carcharias]|uniref:oxysterol-binding protein-related protein 10-like isoform X1 n=2 Tax=Carcharodon carcharias TaxID=13397 RepID=UPI001B7DF7D0|nr:oxysterol-binding protein-related protein 10-like isoform X1 [Carcharodon carcharias]